MNIIKEIVGLDIYGIICSYTDIVLLFYKNEICTDPKIIYNNYRLLIYLDHINSSIVSKMYDGYKKNIRSALLSTNKKKIYYKYYENYIIIIRKVTGIIANIYNISKQYRLNIYDMYWYNVLIFEFQNMFIYKIHSDIIKYFKLYELKNYSIKYIHNNIYKCVIVTHNHLYYNITTCFCPTYICSRVANCFSKRLILINYKTYEIDILKCSNDCGL